MLPNSLHADWAVRAARRGKHVLVEKPACLTATECDRMMRAAKENGVTLLEAVMAAHHPWQDDVRRTMADGRLGKLKEIRTSISFIPKENFSGNYRSLPGMGGGVFYDLAGYWLQLTQNLVPVAGASVTGSSAFSGPNGCDWSFEAGLTTADGIVSRFSGSFEKPYRAGHEIVFETGAIAIHNVFGANIGRHRLKLSVHDQARGAVETREYEPQNYYENQLRFLADVIRGRRENPGLEETQERTALMERIYASARSAATAGGD
jgi:NDP-hexose-3-ketoreductase